MILHNYRLGTYVSIKMTTRQPHLEDMSTLPLIANRTHIHTDKYKICH